MKKILVSAVAACQILAPDAIGVELPQSGGNFPLMGEHFGLIKGVHLKNWKSLRDANLVKQNFDYSCGAASLATVMSYYAKVVTEEELMKSMDRKDGIASFSDLAIVSSKYGFKAMGLALSYEQLRKLRQPVIAYLKPERESHFTVIRGVSESHVWVGDPSWGNRVITKDRFLEMWTTRDDEVMGGKILVVQPQAPAPLLEGAFGAPHPSRLGERVLPLRLF